MPAGGALSAPRQQENLVANSPAQKALQQARTAFTTVIAKLGLGQLTLEGGSCKFEYGGHTVQARAPESGRAFLVGRDGRDTLYTCLSQGVFQSESGVIVVDFTHVVRREVEALVREVEAKQPAAAPGVLRAQVVR
jgi:hypothetical protein